MPGKNPFERCLMELEFLRSCETIHWRDLARRFVLSKAQAVRDYRILKQYGYIVEDDGVSEANSGPDSEAAIEIESANGESEQSLNVDN